MTNAYTPDAAEPAMGSPLAPLKIEVVSDVMCPWCYIGKRRLEKAMAEVPELTFDVTWKPFQLDPTLPADGKDRQQYLTEKFGGPERVAEIYGRIGAAGAEEDIPFAFEKIKKSPNTLNAHRVVRWAGIEGVQNDVVNALFEAFFINGADLSDPETLASIAASAGMDGDMVARLLASDADLAETEADVVHAQAIGVTGVPTFIVAGKYAISGAQPADILSGAFRQIVADALPHKT
ncbi:MAG: DsbA family oxidoreductase [Pseudomonadota bacterium]